MTAPRGIHLFLVVSVVLGFGWALLENACFLGAAAPSVDWVVKVNGRPIRLVEYARTIDAVASDRREALTDVDRQFVLRRLIEEELLVQEGLNRNLIRHNRNVRETIVGIMMESILANTLGEGKGTSPQELAGFYLQLVNNHPSDDPVPPFSELDEVALKALAGRMEQHRLDKAIRDYMAWLRQHAEVVVHAAQEGEA